VKGGNTSSECREKGWRGFRIKKREKWGWGNKRLQLVGLNSHSKTGEKIKEGIAWQKQKMEKNASKKRKVGTKSS